MSNFWILPGNWLVVSTPLKNMSWHDDIPNMMGKIIQIFQTNQQRVLSSNLTKFVVSGLVSHGKAPLIRTRYLTEVIR